LLAIIRIGAIFLVREENNKLNPSRFSNQFAQLLGINEGEKMIRLIDERAGTFWLCCGSLIY
jgi:hypothetical protein